MEAFGLGVVAGIPVIVLTVSVITGDFDYTGRHPRRRNIYRRSQR